MPPRLPFPRRGSCQRAFRNPPVPGITTRRRNRDSPRALPVMLDKPRHSATLGVDESIQGSQRIPASPLNYTQVAYIFNPLLVIPQLYQRLSPSTRFLLNVTHPVRSASCASCYLRLICTVTDSGQLCESLDSQSKYPNSSTERSGNICGAQPGKAALCMSVDNIY